MLLQVFVGFVKKKWCAGWSMTKAELSLAVQFRAKGELQYTCTLFSHLSQVVGLWLEATGRTPGLTDSSEDFSTLTSTCPSSQSHSYTDFALTRRQRTNERSIFHPEDLNLRQVPGKVFGSFQSPADQLLLSSIRNSSSRHV